MEIRNFIVAYDNPISRTKNKHHVLIINAGKKVIPIDIVNLYLSKSALNSIATSARYTSIFTRFFTWLIQHKNIDVSDISKAWLSVTETDLQSWQIQRAVRRITNLEVKPSNKTIFEDASIVHDLYVWAHARGYPVRILPQSTSYIFDFRNRENELLAYIPSKIRNTISKSEIKVLSKNHQQGAIRILNYDQIKMLLEAYADPVFAFMFITSLCTGLRPQGVIQIPYIGFGKNSHITPWDQMKKTMTGSQKDFELTVTEKGSKTRTIKVNVEDWMAISEAYLPLCEGRREKYRLKNKTYPKVSHYWLDKEGNPITSAKQISDATTYAKKRMKLKFECSFYDARHWYATMYILNHLKGNELWREDGYNAAVDEFLRNQLGHESIITSYKHYVSVARLYMASQGGLISEVAKEGGFVSELFTKNDLSFLSKTSKIDN